MDCPNCEGVSLTMSERQGIEIDYCPRCRGVWLDRGELDKIIDRSLEATQGRGEEREPRDYPRQPDSSHDRREHDRHDSHHGGYYKKKKREGFLSDLFDFD
jgi:uncharacterized protein